MQNKALKYLLLALIVAIIVPQIAMASWWNPFSWGIWNRVFHFQQTEQKQEQTIKQDDKKEQPAVNENQQNSGEQVACTMDAKLCPDGSSVGREGPKCEFKACPEVKVETPVAKTADWKTYTNTQYGFELKYPSDFKITVNKNPAGYLNLYLGYSNTSYIGDIAIQVIENDKNQASVQYFTQEKNKALQGFASKCQTCANMDVDAELYNCLANDYGILKIADQNGFFCKNMSQRATAPSPIYVFNGDIFMNS